METESSLSHSQQPATCPYPQPDQFSPCPSSRVLEIHFNIILPSSPWSSNLSPSLRFPLQQPVCTFPLSHTCYMPFYLIILDLITWIISGEEYQSLSSSLYSFPHSSFASSLLGSNILLSTLFPNTLILFLFPNMSDQVSNPHQTTSKIKVLYISVCLFLDRKLEEKIYLEFSLLFVYSRMEFC